MKTLVSFAIAAALATSAHAGEIAKPSWADYRSTVVNKPVNIEVDSRVDTRIDRSKKIEDSYNTAIDKQALNARLDSTKNIATLDTQTASNNASMVGPTQLGLQGGFSGGNLSSTGPTTSIGAGDGSRVFMKQTRELTQSNYTEVGGSNYGAISSLNVGHQGDGDLTMGPKGSIVGSRLGNDQTFVTGDQTQVQGNEQQKQSQTSSNASDTTTVSASK